MAEGRDLRWSEYVPRMPTACPVAWLDAEAPSFMLYTSGSTGKPKGVLHTTAGYMIGAATTFKSVPLPHCCCRWPMYAVASP